MDSEIAKFVRENPPKTVIVPGNEETGDYCHLHTPADDDSKDEDKSSNSKNTGSQPPKRVAWEFLERLKI